MSFITGLGIYLPSRRQSAGDIAAASGIPEAIVRDKLGIEEKVVPGPDDHPCGMGVRAARAALDHAGMDALQVDQVISIVEEHKEYPVWTAGIKLAHDVGAHRAYAYDVGQKCGTSVLALKLAADALKANPDTNCVLVAGGYRNSDLVSYQDPNARFLYNLAAGGGAAVVQKTATQGYEILGSAFRTDGSFSLDVIVPAGGTKQPLHPGNQSEFRLQVPDPAGLKARLEEKSLANFTAVAQDACAKSGITPAQLAHVAIVHMKRSAHREVLSRLGVPESRSIYLSHYGHIGHIDLLLSLKLAEDEGRLRSGDAVLLLSAGIGYVWNALCLRVH